MDPTLYSAATKGDIDVLKRFKDQLLYQVTSPTRNTVLHVIAQYNDSADAIRDILSDQDSGLQENLLTWKNSEGETALYIASRNRRKNIVEQLLTSAHALSALDLEDGVGVVSFAARMVRISNKNGDTPLHEAVNNKDKVIVELLVKADPNYQHLPNNMGKTPLYIALEKREMRNTDDHSCFFRCFPCFIHLLKIEGRRSYDPSLEAILEVCKIPGIEGPHGETILHAAARRIETTEWVAKICKRIPNITKKQDEQGFSPLHYAAYFANYRATKYLLEADKSMVYITADKDKHDCMTPLHIAASKGHTYVITEILKHCQDCFDVLTSKGQNMLHLAAKGQHTGCISYILGKPWGINLLNMKDNDGNTPSHLLLSSLPTDFRTIKPMLEHPDVYVDASNNNYYTPLEMFKKTEIQFNAKKVNILNKLNRKFGRVERIPRRIDDGVNGNSKNEFANKTKRLEDMKKTAETHLVVAALVATVSFAAGFTLPGGYDGNNGPNQGLAVLIKKAAFKVFVLTDTVGLMSSCVAIFLHFTASLYKSDEEKISRRYSAALLFLVIAMISMAITFVTGLYVVLEKSPVIAIAVCIIGGFGILYLLYLIRKVYRDMGFLVDEYIYLFLLIVPFALVVNCFLFLRCIFLLITVFGSAILEAVKDTFRR